MTALTERLSAVLAGRYRIERHLGEGGMASVYLAEDLKHDRKVAVKVLKPELAAVLGAERFVVEIKTTASLQHPHILPLFDSGTADGFLFYVMPFIKGETLREKLNRETQLGVDEAVRIAREVADALDYAHRSGIIHRDIKPENILLHDGRPMVADFGIALALSAAAGGRMTETGLSLGTPHYMSPEQATAEKEISARSDVYSLASVLYEMLAGEPPHLGGSAQQIIMKIITDRARPLTDLRQSVPPHVAAAVSKALEKLPADRFETAKAFSDALGNPAFTTSVAAVTGGSKTQTRRVRPAMWTAGIIVVAALAAGWAGGRSTAPLPEAQPVQFAIDVPDSIVSVNRCCGPAQVLTPDGRTLVFVGMRGNQSGALYRRRLDQLDAELIPGTEGGSSPSFSPDGAWMLFEAGGTLKKVPSAGGPVIPVANTGPVSGATWADNDTIVYARNAENRLWRVAAAGGKPVKISIGDPISSHMYPFALPGGRAVLVAVRRPGLTLEESRIGVVDLLTGVIDTLGMGTRAVYTGGSLIFSAADNTVLAQPFDLDSRRLRGSAAVILTGVSLSGGSNHEFAVSRNGWLTYEMARNSGNDILRVVSATDATVLTLPGRETGNAEDPAISPDGRRVALRLSGSQSDDLWMLDRDQGALNRFTIGGGQSPAWSPDGKRIAYYAPGGDTASSGLYVRTVDHVQAPQLVLRGANVFPGSWTSDGRSLLFNTNRGMNLTSGYDIGVVTVGDTTPRWIVATEFNERQPQASPDGQRLAYTSNRSGRSEVFVQMLQGDGVPVQVSVDGASSPRWSRDGRTLYYTSANRIFAVSFAPGAVLSVQRRTEVNGSLNLAIDINAQNSNWDVFPDGKFLVIDQGGTNGQRRVALIQNWPALARSMGAKH